MASNYDNDTQTHFEMPGLDKGHWYQDEEGAIYIVPHPKYGTAEIEGPDSGVLDQLNEIYRAVDDSEFDEVDTEEVAHKLDIIVIDDFLKRFDPETGYFSA